MPVSQRYLLRLLRAAASKPIVVFAIKVSLVVGTVLNVINQGGALLDGAPLNWLHCALNYLVPFCVSAFSGGRNALQSGRS